VEYRYELVSGPRGEAVLFPVLVDQGREILCVSGFPRFGFSTADGAIAAVFTAQPVAEHFKVGFVGLFELGDLNVLQESFV
jgi:hypothetical protein